MNLNASPVLAWPPGRAPGHAAPAGWPRPAAPSSTSTRSGGQDELVFDGASLVVGADGVAPGGRPPVRERTSWWSTSRLATGPPGGRPAPSRSLVRPVRPRRRPRARPPPRHARSATMAEVYEALVLGTRDYLAKNGFTGAVVGLSGGIDSSLVATVAVDAIGPDRVHGLGHALALLERRVGQRRRATWPNGSASRCTRCPSSAAHIAFADLLAPVLGDPPAGLVDENLQSRVRGVLLMAFSNATGAIVLTTGNKREMATGYSTLYGDSAGGFAVIKDVPKTLVYELCRYRNARAEAAGRPGPVPESVLDKPPVGRAAARPARRPVPAPLRPARPGPRPPTSSSDRTAADLVAEGFDPERGGRGWWGWSTGPSTSGARCPRACASPPRPSGRTAACRSPTATGPAGACAPWVTEPAPRGPAARAAPPSSSAPTAGWSDGSSSSPAPGPPRPTSRWSRSTSTG